ncbi:MAG: peptidase M23 [Bacteroidia bacterium]|nr:peptidase M23 [Bacteroidia bacterium]
MKTLKLTGLLFATTLVVASCSTSSEKLEDAKENMVEAHEDLDKANETYLADVATYRIETADKINANNQSIIEFNARIENEKKDAKADYKKKITELEAKNSDMKKRLEEYKVDTKENWEIFKAEFNYDMEELGKSFKDLTVKNK